MDNQSRSLDETAGHGYGSGYYATSEAISQDASAAYEGYTPTYGSAYDQFAGSDLGALDNLDFSSGSYSQEIDLHPGPPVFSPPTPALQHSDQYSGLDPELALQQVRNGLGHQNASPWTHVLAPGPKYLTPNYYPASPTYHTLTNTTTPSLLDDLGQSLTYTSPGWDAVSNRSVNTDGSGITTCERCHKTFGDSRQARRHATEVHREDSDPQYTCKCSYQVTRKSNYLRHLTGSCRGRISANEVYICICKKSFADLDAHLTHIRVCGKKKAGRPPNSSRSSHG
ncbi:hypothetical protein CCHR01_16876 [Colletotrichum chrysophilum]|uniref:C2H2-type domain-containing protein n=1 Tax=Colletotrichum chrysophilum TaxID=1836956 RepID=A0AAD9A7P0_9PEZI|nr:hypothetical protein CCHR01_16876 [Colletotrichum chrysophilum]